MDAGLNDAATDDESPAGFRTRDLSDVLLHGAEIGFVAY